MNNGNWEFSSLHQNLNVPVQWVRRFDTAYLHIKEEIEVTDVKSGK